ncbi:hypothetical protein GE09DRAFT_1103093 [Coniochaeta sp. 2T2.1]|nr:hypothetical protein GE09DRAFT_1103093 [Coniochaeta sp. 2T2.1]
MAHPVRADPKNNGKGVGIPVFAGEVGEKGGMSILEKFDPVARRDRTEKFDVVRFEKAVWEAKTMGGRDRRGRCLRCRVRDLPCSLERKRGPEKKECEGCRRNNCAYCLRIVCDRETARVARKFPWVKVGMVKGRRKGEIVVWVRDDEEGKVDVDEVRKCAEELLEGEGTRIWGMALDANDTGELVLPSWQEVYFAVAKSEAEKDKAFVDSYLGYETELRAVDMEDLTWKDWFQLQEQRRRARHPYTSREDCHVRPYRRKLAAPPDGKHTDT